MPGISPRFKRPVQGLRKSTVQIHPDTPGDTHQEEGGPSRLVQGLNGCFHKFGGLFQLLAVLEDQGLDEAQLLLLLLRDPLQQLALLLVQDGVESVKLLTQLLLYLVAVLLRGETYSLISWGPNPLSETATCSEKRACPGIITQETKLMGRTACMED